MTAISVQDVSKRFRLYHEQNRSVKIALMRRRAAAYEEFWALRDVSFEIQAGEAYGLIGENGSGKSTLLKCMAKILRPDKGRITTVGRVSALLELGAGFHPELSGRENVYLNASILGLGKKELDRKFDSIVEFAGLERFIDTPVKNYSSGMYVRLGFSVAINVDPDILLVDEVLAVGDQQFQRRCYERFADLRSRGRTIVVVSHALGLVRELCETAVWLEKGELRKIGPSEDVVAAYTATVEQGDDQGEETRWGTRDVVIDDAELLDSAGNRSEHVRSGDPVTIRIRFSNPAGVGGTVFGVTLARDGMVFAGSNTRDTPAVQTLSRAEGVVELVIDRLPLLAGHYEMTVSAHDATLQHAFDVRVHAFAFNVEPGGRHEAYGVAALGGRWRAPDTGATS